MKVKEMTWADKDKVIKLAFGARKMSQEQISKEMGFSEETIRRVIKTYTLVKNDDIQALVESVGRNTTSQDNIKWAYDYHAKEIPADFWPRVDAVLKGIQYTEPVPEDTAEKAKAETAEKNLELLISKLNSIGCSVCECLTAEQASVFTKQITDSINANFDILLQEQRKQTGYLESISRGVRR